MSARYSRVPESVLTDKNVTPTDLRVYAAMSLHVYEGNIVAVGQRRIATLAHCDRRTVRRSLTNLAACGHISVALKPFHRRSAFQLNSPVFGGPQPDRLGGDTRPIVGGDVRPRIDTRRRGGAVLPFPKTASK